MKRRISLLLALVIVLGSFGTAFAAVPETAVDKAKFLESKGILKGNKSNELMLEKEENRQNMVVMLSRLMQEEEAAKAHGVEEAAKFEDVTNKDYKPYIAWSVAKGYTIGQSETKFGAKANVTAQEYSIVLLRALGYFDTKDAKAEYENAFNVAKQLGLLEDTKIEDEKAVLTRDQIAVMIYNALETNVKGTEETLAQKLGIEMPKPDKPQELKVESVRANNLGEIEVVVSNGKLLDEANVKNIDNYRLGYKSGTNVKVNKVLVNEDVITLELDGKLDNNAKYDLVIRNMNKTNKGLNGTHEFTTKDNVKPVVEKAEYLGKNGIKVTMSEPVGKVAERSFLVDGKNVVMNVEAYGREIILTPYGKASFDKDMKELTVRPFKDFAGILSDEKTVKIDSVEDYEKAPVVKAIVAKGNKVIVTFDKDIYNDSVEAYKDSKNKGNIEYFVRGRHAAYATKATKIDTNVVEYEFERTLSDRFTKVEITGVKNHDDVTMEKHIEEELELVVDRSEPIVIKKDVAITGKDSATVEIFFDKDMDGFKDGESVKEIKNHFRLFQTGLNDLRDQDITNKSIKSAVYTGTDSVKVTLENLPLAGKFILEVENFEDNTVIKNRMFREYIDIELRKAPGTLNVTDVKVMRDRNENRIKEIEVIFDQKLDRISAENARNYTLITKDNISYDLDQLKTDVVIELDNNGKRVNLVFVDPILEAEYESIIISNRIKGLKDERLASTVKYEFGKGLEGTETARKDLEDAIKEANEKKESLKKLTKEQKAELEKAIAEAQKVLDDKESTKGDYIDAKAALDKAVKAAEFKNKKEKAKEDLTKVKSDNKKITEAEKEALKDLYTEANEKIDAAKTEEEIIGLKAIYTEKIEKALEELRKDTGNNKTKLIVQNKDLIFKVSKISGNAEGKPEYKFKHAELSSAFSKTASAKDLTEIAKTILGEDAENAENAEADIIAKVDQLRKITINADKITVENGVISLQDGIISKEDLKILNANVNYNISVYYADKASGPAKDNRLAKISIDKDGKAVFTEVNQNAIDAEIK